MNQGRRLIPRILCALACLILGSESAAADEAVLRNGDRLTGKVVRMANGYLVLNTPYAAEVRLAWSDVATLSTDEPVRILLDDETLLNGNMLSANTGHTRIQAAGIGATEPIDLLRISHINPPPEVIGRGVTVSGGANVGFTGTQGNSDTMQLHGDLESVFKGRATRYTLGGEINYESEDERNTVANWRAHTKYDAFLTPEWYLLLNVGFERDRFKDINLRTNLGPGVGHYLWKSEWRNLALEAGFNYVNENLIATPDRYYAAARWSVDFDQFLYRRFAQLFHRHVGLVALESGGNVVIRSKTGFRLPLTDHLSATLQIDLDWDSDPSPGAKSTDTRYIVKLGCLW